jgi:hypothetical protein
MAFDFNTATEQRDFDVIPAGTIVVVQMVIRAGDAGEDGLLKRSGNGLAEGLDCKFIVVEGPYAKRNIFSFMVLSGTTDGHAQAAEITNSRLRGILESARGIKPTDVSEAAKKLRVAEFAISMGFATKPGRTRTPRRRASATPPPVRPGSRWRNTAPSTTTAVLRRGSGNSSTT